MESNNNNNQPSLQSTSVPRPTCPNCNKEMPLDHLKWKECPKCQHWYYCSNKCFKDDRKLHKRADTEHPDRGECTDFQAYSRTLKTAPKEIEVLLQVKRLTPISF